MLSLFNRYIHVSKYARLVNGRRENWQQTVERHAEFYELPTELRSAIANMEVLPSMRGLMVAGEALLRENVSQYNCAYVAVDDVRVFDEILYVLLCGTGVGFSCERQVIANLPVVGEYHPRRQDYQFPGITPSEVVNGVIRVNDSKEGWASAFRHCVLAGYAGQTIKWDLSKIRPAGAPLKTFGGRASGPDPLQKLLAYTTKLLNEARGRRLNSLEVHDLVCSIADIVVVGGVRRAALLSLSNLSDDRMRHAKSGDWWRTNPQRALANNSVAYTETPGAGAFMREWLSLYDSKSGERGIINRVSLQKFRPGRRKNGEFGVNPCAEAVLNSGQFCNLTTVIARPEDSLPSLVEKITKAARLGAIQAKYTNFRYLRYHPWVSQTEAERLCGVSITGIQENEILRRADESDLAVLRRAAVKAAIDEAAKIGIELPAAVTCIKPEGTTSSLTDTAAGIHERFSDFYIRRVRQSNRDPLTEFMKEQGVPHEPDAMKPHDTTVFSFAIEAPTHPRHEGAIAQLERWLKFRKYYCEHTPSVTVTVKENEWPMVGGWVFHHFDQITGVSFLPSDDAIYQQMPYEAITKEQYLQFPQPNVQWEEFTEDRYLPTLELACSGNGCDI
jgi:ribonucleoside-triphosphate reductase